jgi:tRNA threonylcarbamoyladenosine biosynthesis protein TsaB
MRVLAVDTATKSCSVAIAEGEELLAEMTLVSGETHSRHLARLIETLVRNAGHSLDRIEGFAVARGPGSFTGLRIGISTVKGLAVAGNRPVVGVSTLAALAWQTGPTDHLICPMIDARRKEIYAALYRWGPDAPALVSGEQVATPKAVVAAIEQPCIFVGNGASAYRPLIGETARCRAVFVPAALNSIRAATIAMLGARRLCAGQPDDVERLVPTYLRRSDAEIKRADTTLNSIG